MLNKVIREEVGVARGVIVTSSFDDRRTSDGNSRGKDDGDGRDEVSETTTHALWGCAVLKKVQKDCHIMKANKVVSVSRRVVEANEIRWNPTPEGFYKVNIDASIDGNSQVVELGMVIQNHQGWVMAARSQHLQERYWPQIAKATAVLCRIDLAIETWLLPFVVETDALEMANLVNAGCANSTDVGLVIDDIIGRLRGCLGVQLFSFLERRIVSPIRSLN
ncbi:hypothetical protein Dsin_016042 [Dipteronia sinensis]|uniref:RNase H type-1 domain-containing protein n=1 Tax=Dipteronia sinensis TaxID=43782 RepID=A0AAE0ACZ1_9ROSI|nr:hypothetical protein Dsin_016042 [Dipteronia sinensis]